MSTFIKCILCSVATLALAASLHAAGSKTVELKDAKDQSVGTAVISADKAGGVDVKLSVKNLTAGEHALHFHQTAKCEAPGFTTAGGHFNPTNAHHGANNPETPHPHAGDMANFTVTAKGTAKTTVKDPNVTMGDGANSVFANGGTALIIHAKADDLKSDPSGNAGDRVACGLVTK